jgi:hypothetical protein
MTVDQRIQWIALPAGAAADGLHLSVFVAPRLRTDEDATLAPFADFLDWPARIRDTTFAIELSDGASVAARVPSDPPDSTLWTALFGPHTPLAPFVFDDYADRPFVTYSVGDVLGALRNVYARVAAAAPDDLPQVYGREDVEPQVRGLLDLPALDDLRAVARGFLQDVENADQRAARVNTVLAEARREASLRRAPGAARGGPLLEPRLPALRPDGSVRRNFERALLFHVRPEREPVTMPSDGEHFKADVDFHQIVAALGDHPWLLRRLGLVVDLVVDAADIPEAAAAAPGELSIRPRWTSALAASVDIMPRTAFAHQVLAGQTFFAAAPRQPDPVAPPGAPPTGLLSMPAGSFALNQVDVDGAALKAINFAASLEAIAQRPDPAQSPLHQPDQAALPALRTSGLALVWAGRAGALQGMFGRHVETNAAIEHGAPHVLYAEDLLRGYRLDVFDDQPGAWRSLHRCVVTATATRLADPLSVEGEGFFQLSLASAPTAHGQPPDPNGELYVHETLVTWDGWSLSAPRPGKSLSRDPRAPTDDDPATQPGRIANDPLTAIGLRIETEVAAGALPRLRFGRGYRVRLRTVDLAGNGPTLREADRLLASPLTATPVLPPADASRYLRFEPVAAPALVPAGPFGEGASLQRLVIRSDAEVTPDQYAADFNTSDLVTTGRHPPYDGHDDRHVAPPKASFELVERHGLLDDVIGSDGSPPSAARQTAIRNGYEVARREKGSFEMAHDEDQIELPYLPDPLAGGALFFGLPGQPDGEPLQIAFDGADWSEARPLRLRLAAGAGPPEWDPGERVLTVRLPPAASRKARVCSVLEGGIEQMAILRWCEEVLAGEQLERVLRAAKENRSWLITPWHELDLVHAVQQPLIEPSWEGFELMRGRDQTFADLFGIVGLDGQSTEKVDLVATWSETVDDLAQEGPEVRHGEATVFDLALSVAAQGRTDIDPHEVPYSLSDEKLLTFSTPRARTENLPTPAAHRFGDTRYRRVAYRVVAATKFRENFPPEWWTQPERLSRTGAAQDVDVPGSAPPATPAVAYALPAMGWETRKEEARTVRHRCGGSMRVYLQRPWFSSGDGELLGVIVGPNLTAPGAGNYPYITLVGQDPVRGGSPLEFATTATFRNPTAVVDRVELPELSERVSVVAFKPAYDARTRQWFCDVDLDTGDAYMPFVRLALVRYQPHSLPGCEFSRVVLADIVQTLPDRTLTVTRAGDGDAIEISVAGVTYTAIRGVDSPRSDDPALARMVARLEYRDTAIPDDVLGWRAVDGAEVELTRALDGVTATWTGRLVIPPGDGTARRIAVLEEEHLAVDEDTAGQGGLGARVVYADALEL